MKLSAEFKNGMCKLFLKTEDEWEQKLLGAVAKGSDKLNADVAYKYEGHFSLCKGKVVEIILAAGEITAKDYEYITIDNRMDK